VPNDLRHDTDMTGLRTKDRLLSLKDVAELCQVSERTVYRYLRAGSIPIHIGRSVRFRRTDVLDYLHRLA